MRRYALATIAVVTTALAPAVLLLAGACAPSGPASSGKRIPVGASVPPLGYLVDQIGGDHVATRLLLRPGASPHTYEPAPKEILALDDVRLFVAVGGQGFPFESRHLRPLLEHHSDIRVIYLSPEGLPDGTRAGRAPGPETAPETVEEEDLHPWLSPKRMMRTARKVAAALEAIDPASREIYRSNLATFLASTQTLDREIRRRLATFENHRFYVYHPAWGSFAKDYGLRQVAIESDGKPPSARRLADLIDAARKEHVRVIFVQKGIADRSARLLAAEIGARTVALDPLAADWPANLRQTAAALAEALANER